MTRRWLAALAASAAGAAAAAALALVAFPRDASLRRIRAAGVIRIGYAVEAPYAFLTPDGELTGESPEVAKRIASRLGIPRITWRQVEFASLIDELDAGRIDMIASGMFVTEERARRVAFSIPTFHTHQALLVRAGNPRGLHSYGQAADRDDVRIAVLAQAVEESLLRELGMTDGRLVVVPDALTGRVAVETGLVDGFALSSPSVKWLAAGPVQGRTEAAQPFSHSGRIGETDWGSGAFAFRREDRRLLQAWDKALEPFIGSPEHRALVAEFGFASDELPVRKDGREGARE